MRLRLVELKADELSIGSSTLIDAVDDSVLRRSVGASSRCIAACTDASMCVSATKCLLQSIHLSILQFQKSKKMHF